MLSSADTHSINVQTFSYSSDVLDDLRKFDLYYPSNSQSPQPLICFVHGGAWRSEDKADHADLARSLVLATHCPVVVPNYRLTPATSNHDALPFHHPGHAEDLVQFLNFISAETPSVYDPSKLLLIGHSCSAHMLSSIFLDSSHVTPTLSPSSQLLRSVKGIAMSEGLYDFDQLLVTFPAYRDWFIAPAFGSLPSYQPFSALQYPLWPEANIRWMVIHSKGDTLVDTPQSERMYNHLLEMDPKRVTRDFHTLDEEHDDLLKGNEYMRLVKEFAATVFSSD